MKIRTLLLVATLSLGLPSHANGYDQVILTTTDGTEHRLALATEARITFEGGVYTLSSDPSVSLSVEQVSRWRYASSVSAPLTATDPPTVIFEASGAVTVTGITEPANIALSTLSGRTLLRHTITGQFTILPDTYPAAGVYILTVGNSSYKICAK